MPPVLIQGCYVLRFVVLVGLVLPQLHCGRSGFRPPTSSAAELNCGDGQLSESETDIDCGGPCEPCQIGALCLVANDCISSICTGLVCQAPTCIDGAINQDETDIDCGGSICGACADGAVCANLSDCSSGVCTGNICQAPTCSDTITNGDESDADCGGNCSACFDGQDCNGPSDCISGVCTANICQPVPAVQTNYRSIGVDGSVIYGVGVASVKAGSRTVNFSDGASLPISIGAGDVLTIATDTLYIAARNSATQVTIQAIAPNTWSTSYTITRAYTTLQAWEDDREGDLVADGRKEVGVVYNDGPFTSLPNPALTIDGSVTDSSHFLRLMAADLHHHVGTAGTGVVIDGEDNVTWGIWIEDDYTEIDGLEMKRFTDSPGGGDTAIFVAARSIFLERLLIYDFVSGPATAYGIRTTNDPGLSPDASFTARNCIIYGGDIGILLNAIAGHRGTVENTTIYNMTLRGVRSAGGILDVTNTMVLSSTIDFESTGGTLLQSHNMSSDSTAAGTGSLANRLAADQFISLVPGSEDFHLNATSDAINTGTDLSPDVVTDIDNEARPFGSGYDMGADERP